jgi:hypothetical protein
MLDRFVMCAPNKMPEMGLSARTRDWRGTARKLSAVLPQALYRNSRIRGHEVCAWRQLPRVLRNEALTGIEELVRRQTRAHRSDTPVGSLTGTPGPGAPGSPNSTTTSWVFPSSRIGIASGSIATPSM